jgi:hypothetical protein
LRSAVALLCTALVGVVAFLLVAGREERRLAFTLGVVGDRVVVRIDPGRTACQTPVDASAPFDAVELVFGTYALSGPPLVVSVRDASSGGELAAGPLEGGYPDNRAQTVPLEREASEGRISVCVRNAGDSPVALYGNAGQAAYASTMRLDGRDVGLDAQMVFLDDEPATLLSLTPEIFRRAATFRASWVGPWTFWALAAGVVLIVPLLLALALRAAGPRPPAL